MKKIIYIGIILSLFVFSFNVLGNRDNFQERNFGEGLNMDNIQERMVQSLHRTISRTQNSVNQLLVHPMIDSNSKEAIESSFSRAHSDLSSFEGRINNANSIEELAQINREIKEYTSNNQNEIKNNGEMGVASAATAAYESAIEFLEEIQKLIPLFKIMCPSMINEINNLEKGVNELLILLPKLESSINNNDKASMNKLLNELAQLTISMTQDVQKVMEGCPQLANMVSI